MKALFFKITLILFVVTVCVTCSEEFNGQFPVNNTIPAQVTLLADGVLNFPGGATITYLLPDETDLLYVKAVFEMPDGSVQEEKASVFSNSLTLRGFGKSTVVKVKLITVNRSRNESQPVEVEIRPEDSPIYDIFESFSYREGFGGFVLNWNNPLRENVVVSVMRRNNENVYENIENIYSQAPAGVFPIRNLEPVMTDFAVSVRDTYRNYTDTLKMSLEPWFEVLLDSRNFIGIPLSSRFSLSVWGNPDPSVMWDGRHNDPVSGYSLYQVDGPSPQIYFAINLGVKAQLSRFRYWNRPDYYFRLYGSKEIQMYGTNDPEVGNDPESPNSAWILLNPEPFVSFRPSGLDSSIPATEEDFEYAALGEEYEFPLEAPAVQWVRFQQLQNWTGSNGFSCVEIRFWGDPNVE